MHVLILTFGSHGDVLPFIALGAALARRGHAVSLAAPPAFADRVSAAGLRFLQLGEARQFEALDANPDLWDAQAGARLMFRLAVDLARPGLVLTETERARADAAGAPFIAVANTLGFGARLARERGSCRLVTAHLSPFLMRSRFAPPTLPGLDLPGWLPGRLTDAIQRLRDRLLVDPVRLAPLNAVRARIGLPPLRGLVGWLPSPDRLLLLVPSWFAPPQPDWPAQLVQTGFPRGDRFGEPGGLAPALTDFLESGPPPVVVTYGSSMRHGQAFFEAAARACAAAGRRAVLVSSRPEQLPGDPRADRVAVPYARFSHLLPRACALIHHGGIGTLSEALAAGIPQIVVPNGFDQIDNAVRIQRLGLGARLDRSALAGSGSRVLARLLADPEMAVACARARAAMARADGIAEACAAIEGEAA